MRRRIAILGITMAALSAIGLSMAMGASATNDALSTVRSLTPNTSASWALFSSLVTPRPPSG